MLLFMLIISVGLMILPAILCCFAGGWLLLFGVTALIAWLQIGWWIIEEGKACLKHHGDEYV